MTPKALRVKLEPLAAERGLRLATAALDRRLRVLFAEADRDEAHVELVVRWCMAQAPARRLWAGPSPSEFWAVTGSLDCPDGAWEYRLLEYTLALSERTAGPEHVSPSAQLRSLTFWLGYWSDAEAILDTRDVEYAQRMLAAVKKEINAS